MDTQSIRDRILEAYQRGPDAVIELVVKVVTELAVRLEAENAELRVKLGANSRNSSKPPSSDGPGVKPHPKSQRKSSGRKPGGQRGHPGHTLRLVDKLDEIKVHTPVDCHTCGESLKEVWTCSHESLHIWKGHMPQLLSWLVVHLAVFYGNPWVSREIAPGHASIRSLQSIGSTIHRSGAVQL
jgi:hypothetical protein